MIYCELAHIVIHIHVSWVFNIIALAIHLGTLIFQGISKIGNPSLKKYQ